MHSSPVAHTMTGVWKNPGDISLIPPQLTGSGDTVESMAPLAKRARADGAGAQRAGTFLAGVDQVGGGGMGGGLDGFVNAEQMPLSELSTMSGAGITTYDLEDGFTTNPVRSVKWTAAMGIHGGDGEMGPQSTVFVNRVMSRNNGHVGHGYLGTPEGSVSVPFTDLPGVNYFLGMGSILHSMRKRWLMGNIDTEDVPVTMRPLVVDDEEGAMSTLPEQFREDAELAHALFATDGEDAMRKWGLSGAIVSGPTATLEYGMACSGSTAVRNVFGSHALPGMFIGYAATRVPNPFMHLTDPNGKYDMPHLMGVPIDPDYQPEHILQMVPYVCKQGSSPSYFLQTPPNAEMAGRQQPSYDRLTHSINNSMHLQERQRWWHELRQGNVHPCLTWTDRRAIRITEDGKGATTVLETLQKHPYRHRTYYEGGGIAEKNIVRMGNAYGDYNEMGSDPPMMHKKAVIPEFILKKERHRGAWIQLGRVQHVNGPTKRTGSEPLDIRERDAYNMQPLLYVDINIKEV